METIPGSGNWKLTIRREAAGITILRAATCDARARLPETLYGLPVTALGDHALSPTAASAEGEDLLVTCGAGTNTTRSTWAIPTTGEPCPWQCIHFWSISIFPERPSIRSAPMRAAD